MKKFYLSMLMTVGLLISGNAGAGNVCKIVNGQEYATLTDAIAAVEDGVETEIQLIADIEFDKAEGAAYTITPNKNVYLDLNGHKIVYNLTAEKNAYVIMNNGTLTIDDKKDGSGVIELKGVAKNGGNQPTISTSKMLTIKNGNICNSLNGNYAAYAVDMYPNNQPYSTHPTNTLVIEGGVISQMNHPAIRAYGEDYNATKETNGTLFTYTITMKGGKVQGQRGFYLSCKSKTPISLNIEGGEIVARDGGKPFRAIDSQLEANNGDLSKIKINISGNPIIDGFICLANLQGNFTQSTTENITIEGGNFVTNNGVQYGDQAKLKAEKFIQGGTFFFEQGEDLQTVLPYILFEQQDSKGTYACTNDLIYARYIGDLATKEGWEALGYIVTKVGDDLYGKTGEWYKVEKKVKSDAAFADFKKLIAEGYTAVDITGQPDDNGGNWLNKTVIVTKVNTENISESGELPTVSETDAVVIKNGANVTIGGNGETTTIEVYSLNVEEGGTLTIGENATVIVGDGGFGNDLDVVNVTINSANGSSGIVKVSPDAPKTKQKVKVNLYTKAHSDYNGSTITASYWQLFARPTEMNIESFKVASYPTTEGEIAQSAFYTNIYGYDGSHWVALSQLSDLDEKFEGYAISNNTKFGGVVYEFTGWMCLNNDAALNFKHGAFSLMGNSYLAPMSLVSLFENIISQSSETASAEQTIWYYESEQGSFKQVTFFMSKDEEDYQYKQLEPLQGFFMYLQNGSSLNTTVSYVDAVWSQSLVAHPLPAPSLRANSMNKAKITVSAKNHNDELRVYEDNAFSQAFDNGVDATKMMNLSGMFNLYVATEEQNYANYATDNLEGTMLTFNASAEAEYTLSFSNVNTDYMLLDMMTGEKIEMTEGNTYTFSAEPNSTVERFQIVSTAKAPTAIQNTKSSIANKMIKNGMMLIERNNQVYNAQGQNIK